MSRKRFDEVERQVRDIGVRHWRNLDGRMIRSASEELRKGRVVVFGNRHGNIYFNRDEPITDWKKASIRITDIGLFLSESGIVVELSLTEAEILNSMWRISCKE